MNDCNETVNTQASSWVGLGWVGLGWVGLGWVGLGWVGLGWVGLGWEDISPSVAWEIHRKMYQNCMCNYWYA